MRLPPLTIPAKYADPSNIGILILTCALAHYLPYHLILFSYAILGPAHYLTQISWLHDRGYFAHSRWLAPLLAGLSIVLTVVIFSHASITVAALVLALALTLTFCLTLPPAPAALRGFLILASLLPLAIVIYSPQAALWIAILLPTVLHIFVFTGAFMWAGARRNGKASGYIALIVLIFCAASFLIPQGAATIPTLDGIDFFRPVTAYLQNMLGLSTNAETQMFGFLSFAYTYHYLNWFSKAEIIRWHAIPRERMLWIVGLYAVTLFAYSFNYATGFFFILLLSEMHVLLEFPLNLRTFATLARRNNQ